MSERIQKNDNRATIRWKLFTGASVLALIASSPSIAGEDADHPLLWIEIGGDASILSGTSAPFTAPFLEQTPVPAPFSNGSPISLQKPPRFTFGGEGKITFQPEDSNWAFSAAIRYGRSSSRHNVQHQTALKHKFHNGSYDFYKNYYYDTPSRWTQVPTFKYATAQKFAETKVAHSEQHMVLDFQAGQDVGLGLFGHGGASVLSAGVRMARFRSHADVTVRAKPDVTFYSVPFFSSYYRYPEKRWSTYYLHGQADRKFNGVGPSISWSASAPIAGTAQDGQLSLDWGINGALLFGRQSANVSHHTTQRDFRPKYPTYFVTPVNHRSIRTNYVTHYKNTPPGQNRSRNVTVPNLGANIGISYRIEDAKLSIGYRTDYFFGAMDTGIDAAKKSTLGFNGLYASISVGLGD